MLNSDIVTGVMPNKQSTTLSIEAYCGLLWGEYCPEKGAKYTAAEETQLQIEGVWDYG